MHYKGEEASPMYTVWAALLAENDHWQRSRHGKRTYHPDPSNSQNRLSWANRPWFLRTNPWRCRSADVKPAVIIAGLTALQTFYLQAPVQPTAQRSSSKVSDRDGWDMRMLRALDISLLTCSNCAAKAFRDIWNSHLMKPVSILLDSEILLEHYCFLSELLF